MTKKLNPNKQGRKIKNQSPLRKVLNELDKDFDEKIRVLLKTPPIREKDIKKSQRKKKSK
ncbi:MAG: hypothetical protein NY202_04340 [Mollicutes bacterium UO1]